jgi:hypothetical protein
LISWCILFSGNMYSSSLPSYFHNVPATTRTLTL